MKISVIGAGSWGLALCDILAYNGHDILVYSPETSETREINQYHTSQKYTKNKTINEHIKATDNLCDVLDFSKHIVIVIPSKAIISCFCEIKKIRPTNNYFFISATKGLVNNKTIQQTIKEFFPENLGIVSILGPSFSAEVIDKQITCISSVSEDEQNAIFVQKLFSNTYFKVYTQSDTLGAELFACGKNAIAIGSGILSGLGYGENTKASLITRGLKELLKLGKAMGAKEETALGLTGIGDLVLTCSSNFSRNFQAGYTIGKDNSAHNFLQKNQNTVEGLNTILSMEELAQSYNLKLPILHSLYLVVYKNATPSEMVQNLIKLPPSSEQVFL